MANDKTDAGTPIRIDLESILIAAMGAEHDPDMFIRRLKQITWHLECSIKAERDRDQERYHAQDREPSDYAGSKDRG